MHPLFRSKPVFSAFLFIVVGLTMAGGGAWLLFLGGSSFYLVAGSGILLTGISLLTGTPLAFWLYGFVLTGIVALAVREVGFNGWELEARLLAPAILGLHLLASLLVRHRPLGREAGKAGLSAQARLAMLAPALGIASAIAVGAVGFLNSAGNSDAATDTHHAANASIHRDQALR